MAEAGHQKWTMLGDEIAGGATMDQVLIPPLLLLLWHKHDSQDTYTTAKAHIRQSRHIYDSQGTYTTVKAHIRQSRHIYDSQGQIMAPPGPLPGWRVQGSSSSLLLSSLELSDTKRL